jgi:hypothetical protein
MAFVFAIVALLTLGLLPACARTTASRGAGDVPPVAARVEEPHAPAVESPAPADTPPAPLTPRERLDHHMKQVADLGTHFERLLREPCPRFPSPAAWQTFIDGEVERAVLLAAHLKEASAAAKATGDEVAVRLAKAPQRRTEDAYALAAKLQNCADDNGSTLDLWSIARRIEREVPQRRAEIRLPR